MDKPEKKLATKTSKTKKKTIKEAVDDIVNEETQIVAANEGLEYKNIDSQKTTIQKTIQKIETLESDIQNKKQEIEPNNEKVQIITEHEFNEKMEFIEKYQDIESLDIDSLLKIYKKLSQYVKECKLFIDSTSMTTNHI